MIRLILQIAHWSINDLEAQEISDLEALVSINIR